MLLKNRAMGNGEYFNNINQQPVMSRSTAGMYEQDTDLSNRMRKPDMSRDFSKDSATLQSDDERLQKQRNDSEVTPGSG